MLVSFIFTVPIKHYSAIVGSLPNNHRAWRNVGPSGDQKWRVKWRDFLQWRCDLSLPATSKSFWYFCLQFCFVWFAFLTSFEDLKCGIKPMAFLDEDCYHLRPSLKRDEFSVWLYFYNVNGFVWLRVAFDQWNVCGRFQTSSCFAVNLQCFLVLPAHFNESLWNLKKVNKEGITV